MKIYVNELYLLNIFRNDRTLVNESEATIRSRSKANVDGRSPFRYH